MRVATALVADYAAQTNDGKLIVAGIFDTLFCLGDTPFRHPHMAVAIRIHLHPGEAPKHQIRMKLVDPRGGRVRLDSFMRFIGDDLSVMQLFCPSVV